MPLVKFGGRRLLLSASDLVLPTSCGIVLHLFIVISLLITLIYLASEKQWDITNLLQWFAASVLICHLLIIIINIITISIAIRLKVMSSSKWLTRCLYCRAALNLIDVALAIWGLFLIIIRDLNQLNDDTKILVIISVSINWMIIFIGCCGVCCLSVTDNDDLSRKAHDTAYRETIHGMRSSSMANLAISDKETPTANKLGSKIRTVCCACLWEHRAWNNGDVNATFNAMADLMAILTQTHHIDNEDIQYLALSDILTGLQLYRMLQKHYRLDDLRFYHPYKADNYQHTV